MPRSLLLHLALLTTIAAQPADLVTIRGRVTNPITGQPRANVEMNLERDWKPITLPVRTNSAGQFAFPPVQREIWMVSAQAPDIGTVYFGSDAVNMNAFEVNPPDKETFIEFLIAPRGSLQGKVVNADGVPMQHVTIEARTPYINENQMAVYRNRIGFTNEFGEYAQPHIADGEYRLCAVTDTYDRVPPVGFIDLAAPATYLIYPDTCFPPVLLSPNSPRTFNFKLYPTPGLRLSGKVIGIKPSPLGTANPPYDSIDLSRLPHDPNAKGNFRQGSVNSQTLEFAFEGLEAGRYSLRIYKLREEGPAIKREVELKANLLDLVLDPTPQATVRFTITSDDNNKLNSDLKSVQLVDESMSTLPWSASGPPLQVMDGDYWLRFTLNDGVCITAATQSGETILRKRFHISGGKDHTIALHLSKRCAKITGRVTSNGKPVSGARVVAVLNGSPEHPLDLSTDVTNGEGTFAITGLSPGAYPLAAWIENQPNARVPFSLADEVPVIAIANTSTDPPVEVPLYTGKK